MKIIITHSDYGCDTGCCGHTITFGNKSVWSFFHPRKDYRIWAEDLIRAEFGKEHIADLDWENSIICED